MNKVWVVMGTSGDYSDRTEWPVVAFTNWADAKKRIEDLTILLQQMPNEWKLWPSTYYELVRKHMEPLDPDCIPKYEMSYFFNEVKVVS